MILLVLVGLALAPEMVPVQGAMALVVPVAPVAPVAQTLQMLPWPGIGLGFWCRLLILW